MTPEDFLSRLSAGLDRDAEIARAAAEAAEIENGDWFAGETDHHGIGMFESEEAARSIDYFATAETEHITEQSPARTLRQVDAIRKLLADVRDPKTLDTDHLGGSVDYDSFREGVEAAADLLVERLASIYADPAEERT